jgi:hypothetical protein
LRPAPPLAEGTLEGKIKVNLEDLSGEVAFRGIEVHEPDGSGKVVAMVTVRTGPW